MSKAFSSNGFTIKLSTDEHATIHAYVIEEKSILITGDNGLNEVCSHPQFGVSFFTGVPLETIRHQLEIMLSYYHPEFAKLSGLFLLEFLEDKENLRHTPKVIESDKGLN